MNRAEVRELIGVPDPPTIRPRDSYVGPRSPWMGTWLQRVLLVSDEATAIPCLFLTPQTEPPWHGAAVAVHQHNGEYHLGKSEPAGRAGDPSQAYGLALAQLGIPTLIPDLSGFEERRGAAESGADFERLEAGHLLTESKTLLGRHVSDIAMAVSWLSEHPSISGGVGVVGHSLGGQVAFFALACDQRLRAAVVNCGVATLRSLQAMNIPHNLAWYVPGIVTGGDMPAVAHAIADQKLVLRAGSADPIFPVWAVREVAAALDADIGDFEVFPGGHGFPQDVQQQALLSLRSTLTGQI